MAAGARLLVGGGRATEPGLAHGFYMQPTLLENAGPAAEVSTTELFGPIAVLYRVSGFEEALSLANDSPYGLTASVHTRNIDRALTFVERVETGVAVINAGTHGSEPHMPFGGRKASGNGTREPGTEALDIYSELQDVYINVSTDRAFA
jgi:aldehyde dehydrogenase (NAD+)